MANDPGLSTDGCIFMEAISGDGGNHDATNVWWLSPDIKLVGPISGPDNPDAGQINPVKVRFHRKPDGSNCHFIGDEAVTVELWVANPSLVMAPRGHGSKRVGFIGSPMPDPGASSMQQIDWDVPPSTAVADPESPGHKCLIARVYSSSASPSNVAFFLPGDQHVAQHNLCIVPAPTPGLQFVVNTVNPSTLPGSPLQPARVKLRAILDLVPNKVVLGTVTRKLQSIAGFQSLRTTALPGGFKFDLTGFQVTNVVDHSHPGSFPAQTNPSFEAQIGLEPLKFAQLKFLADLSAVPAGQACIFHLIQSSVTNVIEGGLTLVAVKH